MAECETACHETRRDIDLPLPVEGIEQSGSERLDIGGQIVEEVAAIAGDAAAGTFRYRARYVQLGGPLQYALETDWLAGLPEYSSNRAFQ